MALRSKCGEWSGDWPRKPEGSLMARKEDHTEGDGGPDQASGQNKAECFLASI
jgi:hypothetical protein